MQALPSAPLTPPAQSSGATCARCDWPVARIYGVIQCPKCGPLDARLKPITPPRKLTTQDVIDQAGEVLGEDGLARLKAHLAGTSRPLRRERSEREPGQREEARPVVHPLTCGGCGCKSLTGGGAGPCSRCGWRRA